MQKRGILLIGHGSRTGNSSNVLEKTAAIMQKKTQIPVQHCFLEFNHPDVREGLNLLTEKADTISAVPMLLSSGTHTEKTIPDLLNIKIGETKTFEKNGKKISLTYTGEPIGAEEALADILIKKANFPA
ncbi:MAG: sirohydrochlorin nickelochelatase [Methanocorpusculum sp.]|nr:sirohydrochlorin nickelochelatase [Methanocorpusculum sp.]